MWGAPEEPPDAGEGAVGPPHAAQVQEQPAQVQEQPVSAKEICEDKSQLENFKDIMLKNKNDLKRKEDKLQEYASKLSEIKSRAKLSRRSKDGGTSSVETTPKSKVESIPAEGAETEDIGEARTPKAKSSLLQRKLAENRKVFEKRSKEMTANKRAVEEKVEAIRQQMDQTDMTLVESQKETLAVTPIRPVLVTQIAQPPIAQLSHFQDKDNKIAELSNRILELETTVIDLQDNLKEKDSVIEAKTKAVTLMSADLSKKGKTTLDTLEETKDEMRTMQKNFVLIETSLKGKNDNLLEQLHERNDRVTELETTVDRYEREMEEKRLADTASASQSRSTMDTLADTRDAMRSMQENFVLIETSLKEKIENLLQQLENREIKLAEAESRIHKLESGAGISPSPEIPDLRYRIDRLEQSNRVLQDEKYELQKNNVELQEKIVSVQSTNENGLIIEKDNRIAELENLIVELKNSNQLLEEESKTELEKRVVELATMNEESRCKIDDLEKINNDLETRINELLTKIPNESDPARNDDTVGKLTKELDDLNKSMIKIKAQHKAKLRNLQKQLESFKMVSDANAELIKLGNQVALLEEEKGNLQLSLVDFDELKASAGDWQDRIVDLESRVSTQANDIQNHIEAIAILENQKLDLMQELHTVKQEISSLEAENAESENLRVTAEMKVVDLEEQLESLNETNDKKKSSSPTSPQTDSRDLLETIERLTRENREFSEKLEKLDEKPSSDSGSTESFETINEDKNETLKKMEELVSRNSELEEKLSKLEEAARSNVGSTESFETINDVEKIELSKKIEILSRENNDLLTKLNKFEEKGSSDSGSTESFEKISDNGESSSRIEALTSENNDLVIRLTKIEEKYENLSSQQKKSLPIDSSDSLMEEKLENLVRENNDLVISLTKLQEKLSMITDENKRLEKLLSDSKNIISTSGTVDSCDLKSQLDSLTMENNDLIIKLVKSEEKNSLLKENLEKFDNEDNEKIRETLESSRSTVSSLENEIDNCRILMAQQTNLIDDVKTKLSEKEMELQSKIKMINDHEASIINVERLQQDLDESFSTIEEWKLKCNEIEENMKILETTKISIEEKLEIVQNENKFLIEQSKLKDETLNSLKRELDDTLTSFEFRLLEERDFIVKQDLEISNLKKIVETKDVELHEKYSMLQNEMIKIDGLQDDLNDCKDQLRQSEETMSSLNEEISRLNSLVSSSKEETISSQAEIIILREELQSKSVEKINNDEVNRLLKEKENLYDETKRLLDEQIHENENLRIIMENLNAEIENIRTSLVEKENTIVNLQIEKSTMEKNLEELAKAKIEANNRIDILQCNLNDSEKHGENLKIELADCYKMLELVKTKHVEDSELQNRRLEDLFDDLNAKNSDCEILQRDLTMKINECEELRVILNERTSHVEDLERRSLELEDLRVELSKKNKMIGDNVTEQTKIELERIIEELKNNLEKLEFDFREQLQNEESAKIILEQRIKDLESKLEESESKNQEQLQNEEKAKINLDQRIKELESKLEESESNTQQQLQKRKILAANLKKKTIEMADHEAKSLERESKIAQLEIQLTELQSQAHEFEEKWTQEKTEKDSANLKIKQMTKIMENQDQTIVDLEERLNVVQNEASTFQKRVDDLSNELVDSKEKINSLIEQTTEMGDEIERLRLEIDAKSSEIDAERIAKNLMIADREKREANIVDDETKLRQALDEATEKARELGVRMQVMETEYVQQLNAIQNLRTENGMLASKQAQISEKLENTEKESAERKLRLDELEREISSRRRSNNDPEDPTNTVESSETEIGEEIGMEIGKKNSTISTTCDNCDQCQTVVQALEAKLQERDAEIENLDNELANSIGNFVHMRESLRVSDLINQSGSRNRSSEDSRDNNDLATQYNALVTSNNEIRDQLNATISENQRLKEKIEGLQAVNDALRERIEAAHEELIESREATTRLQTIDSSTMELTEKLELREIELKKARSDLESARKLHDEWTMEMTTKIEHSTMDNERLTLACDDLTRNNDSLNEEIGTLKSEIVDCRSEISKLEEQVKDYKEENAKMIDESSKIVEKSVGSASSFFVENKDGPQLFDAAKAFGLSETSDSTGQREIKDLRDALDASESEKNRLIDEIERLKILLTDQQFERERTIADCQRLNDETTSLRRILEERDRIITDFNGELNDLRVESSERFDDRRKIETLESEMILCKTQIDEQTKKIVDREATIVESIENVRRSNDWCRMAIDVVSSSLNNLEEYDDPETIPEPPNEIFQPLQEIVKQILIRSSSIKRERSDLLKDREDNRRKLLELQREVTDSNDAARIQDLETLVDRITRERDIKQLQMNDLTRSLEEMQESVENASSTEESRLRNLQASLDEALTENERLKIEIIDSKRKFETNDLVESAKESAKIVETLESSNVDSNWKSDLSNEPTIDDKKIIDEINDWDDNWPISDDQKIDDILQRNCETSIVTSLQPTLEIMLNTKIAELEDKIKDMKIDNEKLIEQSKIVSLRNEKMLKKLKSFKLQNDDLRRQLSMKKASTGFGDLDSAIEEELKSQITKLEKSLSDSNDEVAKIKSERDNMSKRIDVLTSANERLVEMKERQDMDVRSLQIRVNDLSNQLRSVEWQFKDSPEDDDPTIVTDESQVDRRQTDTSVRTSIPSENRQTPISIADCSCKKYREQLEELRDEIEALASENEQLQQLLEEQKMTRQNDEKKFADEIDNREKIVEKSARRNEELENELKNVREELKISRERLEISTMDLKERLSKIGNENDALKVEIAEKTNVFDTQSAGLKRDLKKSEETVENLQRELSKITIEEKEFFETKKCYEELKEKFSTLNETMAEVTDLLNARVQEVVELKRELQITNNERNEALVNLENLTSNRDQRSISENRQSQEYLQNCETLLALKSEEFANLEKKYFQMDNERSIVVNDLDEKILQINDLRERLNLIENERVTLMENLQNLREENSRLNEALRLSNADRESSQSELSAKEQQISRRYDHEIDRLNEESARDKKISSESIEATEKKLRSIEEREIGLKKIIEELRNRETDVIAQFHREISEKDCRIAILEETVANLEIKIGESTKKLSIDGIVDSTSIVDDRTISGTTIDDDRDLTDELKLLRSELTRKNEEIEDYRYQLSENTYPSIIQALQDQLNRLYDEKSRLEEIARSTMENLSIERDRAEQLSELLKIEKERRSEDRREHDGDAQKIANESSREKHYLTTIEAKNVELQNLKVEIEEKGSRFRELHDHYESAEIEINEMRIYLASKDEEIRNLRTLLESTYGEMELLKRGSTKPVGIDEPIVAAISSGIDADREQTSNELDLALYMLHQRDVRVEELTHELMQLLEERDTLQLRLSDAIRINEELRKSVNEDVATPSDVVREIVDVEPPLVEQPSPSRSVGPVEIAKEAIDTPSEEKVALDQKLSQLRKMGHRRDVRLMDDRESRHNQQMSLITHRDVLSTLPPEAAARLVNANYTLSRDVQSQSSVLMNWLWGKSTPKVVHM